MWTLVGSYPALNDIAEDFKTPLLKLNMTKGIGGPLQVKSALGTWAIRHKRTTSTLSRNKHPFSCAAATSVVMYHVWAKARRLLCDVDLIVLLELD
jgi:hypothetical protein